MQISRHPTRASWQVCTNQCVVRQSLSRTVQPAWPSARPKHAPEETSCLVAVLTAIPCLGCHLRAVLLRPASAFDVLLICASSDDIRPDISSRTGYRKLWSAYGQRALM